MKKIIYCLVLLFSVCTIFAEDEKISMIVGTTKVQLVYFVDRRVDERQIGLRGQLGVAGLLEQTDEAQIELRRGEESAIAPGRGEVLL